MNTSNIWLTDKLVERLPLPERGKKVHYDGVHPRQGHTAGFGIRLSASGAMTT